LIPSGYCCCLRASWPSTAKKWSCDLSDENIATVSPKYISAAAVNPKYISEQNAKALVGQGYRWCRDKAHELGVKVIAVGRKRFIPAAEFFAALERASQLPAPEVESPEDATASVLASLGLEAVR
jgi:hypothetical protein